MGKPRDAKGNIIEPGYNKSTEASAPEGSATGWLSLVLPSLIEGGLSALGGYGGAKLQERTAERQMKFQGQENALNRRVSLYNTALERAFAEYASKKDAAKAKRLRSSIIGAFRDVLMVGGPGMVMPIAPEPRLPSAQQVAQQSRGIARTLGAG